MSVTGSLEDTTVRSRSLRHRSRGWTFETNTGGAIEIILFG